VLEVTAERLVANTRNQDTVARLGGDEFVVVLEDISEITCVKDIAKKLIQEVSQPIFLDNKVMEVTASIGIAISTSAGYNSKQLISSADSALYKAKSAGKNTYICA
jgi:diguanylate cyclase (GGDEF)-like protein